MDEGMRSPLTTASEALPSKDTERREYVEYEFVKALARPASHSSQRDMRR